MASQEITARKSEKMGYIAFLVCGLCVGFNLLAYLPAQTFVDAETTEFTATLMLLLIFVAAAFVAVISTIKNFRDLGLVLLLLSTVAFVAISLRSSWEGKTRVALQLSYAIFVFAIGTFRLVFPQRRPE
jgi:hypothetical protein